MFSTTRENEDGSIDFFLDVPCRSMWGQAEGQRGYCGETSFQSHGIYHGNWISSEVVRNHADGRELLIGENEIQAAEGLKFAYEKFPNDEPEEQGALFVEWARQQLDHGNLPVAGFLCNKDSDLDYDHIMIVIGYKKDADDKTLGLFFNDLYVTTGPMYFCADSDVMTREEFLGKELDQPYCIPKGLIDAIALQGVLDDAHETRRMKLNVPIEREPDWGVEDKLNEEPIDIELGCDIIGLTPGQQYAIVRFDTPSSVPSSNFVGSMAWTKSWQFVAEGSTHQMPDFDVIKTDWSVFYRVVECNETIPETN